MHDEVVLNYYLSDGCLFEDLIRLMTTFNLGGKPIFKVPIEVSVSVCRDNWAEKEDLEIDTIIESELKGKVRERNWNDYEMDNQGVITKKMKRVVWSEDKSLVRK